jgi:hypothetical protein
MLAAVSNVCVERKLPVQVAVEELMGCGYGVCMTCVMPIKGRRRGRDSEENGFVYARSCTEGPVFNGANVVWDGAVDLVSVDQGELSPAGVPRRHTELAPAGGEHAPPGN